MVKRTLIAATAAERRAGTLLPERLHLLTADKSELDRRIAVELKQGWLLVFRSYTMDEGHGAELVRGELHHAA